MFFGIRMDVDDVEDEEEEKVGPGTGRKKIFRVHPLSVVLKIKTKVCI